MGAPYAFLIAIEAYQQPGIPNVEFAVADAKAFHEVLMRCFNVPAANICLWVNQDATQSRLSNDLTYGIRQLGPEDKFIFFYAGHGFFANGFNRVTTWDSHPTNLAGTTTCLDQVLFTPLKESRCRSALVFIDACAASLKEHAEFNREILTDLTPKEFEDLARSSDYSAAFFSCSPNERSYSSPKLEHGIWTHHLLMALRGDAKQAVHRDRIITGDSLKDYLSLVVPEYIRDHTSIQGQQRPFAILGSNGAFEVIRVPEPDQPATPLPHLTFQFERISFRGDEIRSFKELDGFDKKRGHTVPNAVSASAASWGKKLLDKGIVAELEKTKDNAKGVLSLNRRDVRLELDKEGGGSIDTDHFRFTVSLDQNNDDPSTMVISRRVILRASIQKLPSEFDNIFQGKIDEMIIPVCFEGKHYDDVADAMESFADANGATFEGVSSEGLLTIQFPNRGPRIHLDSNESEVRISGPGTRGCIALIRLLQLPTVKGLLGTSQPALGSAQPKLGN